MHPSIAHDQQHYMRILANGSSSSELEAIKPVHGVRALYINVITYHSTPAKSLAYNPRAFHISMLPSHTLSANVRGLAHAFGALSDTLNGILLIQVRSSPSFWLIPHSYPTGHGRQDRSIQMRFQDPRSRPSGHAGNDHRRRSRHHSIVE
jgi:hypothetical protein